MSSNNDANLPVDQPSTSGGSKQPLQASQDYGTSVPVDRLDSYGQGGLPSSYYPSGSFPQQPQRSPILPHSDGQMPPQIIVPKPDQSQTIPQYSPAGTRVNRSTAGWPSNSGVPPDPSDPNQPSSHYPPMSQMMPGQQGQPIHNYPQGMAPLGYWAPPMHHIPGHPPPGHPYYLQVPPQHHAYGGPPKPMEGYQNGPNDQMHHPHMQPTSSSQPMNQPRPNSTAGAGPEDDERRRLQQQAPHMHLSPGYHQGPSMPLGMHRPMHPQMMPPHMTSPAQIPPYIPTQLTHMLKSSQKEAVEKLVGVPSEMVPVHTIPQRREFFERLVLLNDEQGEQLTAPPQVSKSAVDLHRLYIAVRRKGGFEQVTKEKSWKALCTEANPRMAESSAAGYQLRRHYQKYLLTLECQDTGQSAEELKQFAEKLKKKKKEKEGLEGPSTPIQASSTAGPPTPNSIRSAATPTPQHGIAQPSPSSYPPVHGPPPQGYAYGADPNYYYQQQNPAMAPQQPMMPGSMPPPQGAWPGAYPPGAYPHPQIRMLSSNPSYYPPHQQQPATSMEYQPQPQPQPQQNLGAQLPTDRPSSSMSSSAAAQAPVSSRPPSQAPQHHLPPTTPDNRAEESAPQRPAGHTPNSNSSAIFGQPPPQGPLGSVPPPNAQGYYGQPPVNYPPRMPPGVAPSSKSPYPPPGYQMDPPNYIPPQHGMYPPPPQGHQPGMWSQQPLPQQRYGMPVKPHQIPAPRQPQMQRPQPPIVQPPAQYFQGGSNQQMQMPSPGSVQRSRHLQQPLQASTSAPHPSRHPLHQSAGQYPFAPHSLEANATKMAYSRKRPRIFAREFAGISQRRLMMSLRSGQELEVKWALNALTAMLYDDTQHPLRIDQTDPQLLSLLVEHLRATLALLYPNVDFDINLDKEDDVMLHEEDETVNYKEKQDSFNSLDDSTNTSVSFNSKTRTDCQVKVEQVGKPPRLRRLCKEQNGDLNGQKNGEEGSTLSLRQQIETGKGSCFADRLYKNLKSRLDARRSLSKPTYSLWKDKENSSIDDGYNSDRENNLEENIDFFYRRNYKHEVWDRFAQPDCSLLSRPAPLNERDPIIQELADRCICLSNLIRGLAFVPINCRYMHSHRGLLNICSKLLMLCVQEDEQQRKIRRGIDINTAICSTTSGFKNNEEEEESMDVDPDEKPNKPKTIEDHFNADDQNKFNSKQCDPERDSNEKLLLETANILRDDAFVVLSQLSVHLDLYNMRSEISYPLLDALLHWAVTTNIQAQDPIHLPGTISPKAYVFEIISKLSLLDKNIDLLLSTGCWPRIEEFVRVVCNCITMAEELPLREFAIVILQAISVASEPVCIIAVTETQVVQNLISFLEIADQAMTAIANTDGLAVLRDNTERIGTSIGMLRRAIQILFNLVQHEPCRPYFVRHQDKLLSFTVSSIMDSRVAVTAANILFDIQNLPSDHIRQGRELSDEDYVDLSKQFHSCSWRLSDSDSVEDQRINSLSILMQPSSLQLDTSFRQNPILMISPALVSVEPFINGLGSVAAINGSSNSKKKSALFHPDGAEMSELEKAMLHDSDTESVDEKNSRQPPVEPPQNDHCQQPQKTTVSDSVKEKLTNHIRKHEHSADADMDEPDAKRQRIVGNGVISPKCNGDLNNKSRPSQSGQQKSNAENGTPGSGNGSMTAVA